METRRTLNNLLMIRLDPENNSIKLRNGFDLYVDNSFEPEKNATVTGTVFGLPSHLKYSGKPNDGMPWLTPLEIKMGDKVIFYYLSVINALKRENKRFIIEGDDRYVFIEYQYMFAVVRDNQIIPVNGYCLIEATEDPSITEEKERMKKIGMELIITERRINNQVTYGIIRYAGVPNKEYVDFGATDRGVDVSVGDIVVVKKTADIPLQYNLHAKIDGGKPYLRVQRRNLLAKI